MAENTTHFREYAAPSTACGMALSKYEGLSFTDTPNLVLCTSCRGTVRFSNAAKKSLPAEALPKLGPLSKPGPVMVPRTAVHEHDCETCLYLGTRIDRERTYDLYVDLVQGTLVARHGKDSDYISGAGAALVHGMLAIAMLLAVHKGAIPRWAIEDWLNDTPKKDQP